MLPLLIGGGLALTAVFLGGCGSESPEPTENTPPPPSTKPQPLIVPRILASGSSKNSPSPVSSRPAGPLDCKLISADTWNCRFEEGLLLSKAKLKEMIQGGSFCLQSRLNLATQKCPGEFKRFPLLPTTRSIALNLNSAVGTTLKCGDRLEIKESYCDPVCKEADLFSALLPIGTMLSLTDLLRGDGNGDGTMDLVAQLSDGQGVYLAQKCRGTAVEF